MNRNFQFAPNEWYHCFSRGVDKRTIYLDHADYRRFQMLLYTGNDQSSFHLSTLAHHTEESIQDMIFTHEREKLLVDIGAYALMPNHYHLLLREREEGGITSFMRRVNTAYAMYFNKKYERTGALFSGKFKALHVDTDPYLRRVTNYIHGNPAELFEGKFKTGTIHDERLLERSVSTYQFSSLCDYEGVKERRECSIVARDALTECLEDPPSFTGVIEDFETFYAPERSNQESLWK